MIRELTSEQVELLVSLFSQLRKEYENYRRSAFHMESGIQYQARMIELDLISRGYFSKKDS